MAVEFGRTGTIYDAPPAHPVDFASAASDLEEDLGAGFQAAHIWVTNPTNQYLYLPDVPDVVPPGTFGRVLPCRNTDVGRASWTIPSRYGIQQPVSTGGKAILIFLNAGIDVTPQSGSTDGRVQLPWQAVGSKTTSGAGGDNITTGPVAAGALTLGIAIKGGGIASINVTGVQSGTQYEQSFSAQMQAGWITIPINGAADSTYFISWGSSTGAGVKVSTFVSALAMGYPTLGQSVMGESIPVAIASDQTPLPWQAPTSPPKQIYARGLAAAGTQVIVPAVAGQTIRVFGIQMALDEAGFAPANGTWVVEDSVAGFVFAALDGTGPVASAFTDCHGAPGSLGNGLRLRNNDSIAHNGSIAVTYSQA